MMKYTVCKTVDFNILLCKIKSNDFVNTDFAQDCLERCGTDGSHICPKLLAVCMLHVVPLNPREVCYWKTVYGAIIYSNFLSPDGSANKYEDLMNVWKKHKKKVLQNLHFCKYLLCDNLLINAIDSLLKTFSAHWLNLPVVQMKKNNVCSHKGR